MRQADQRERWDAHAIKAEVHRRGLTLTELATSRLLEPSACRVALRRPNQRGEQAIAEFIGRPLHVLWPERHRAASSPDRPSTAGAPKPSRIARAVSTA